MARDTNLDRRSSFERSIPRRGPPPCTPYSRPGVDDGDDDDDDDDDNVTSKQRRLERRRIRRAERETLPLLFTATVVYEDNLSSRKRENTDLP